VNLVAQIWNISTTANISNRLAAIEFYCCIFLCLGFGFKHHKSSNGVEGKKIKKYKAVEIVVGQLRF
jgi:hypothetical protein